MLDGNITMNIIACIKLVPDPETPASAYGIDHEAQRITLPNNLPLVISPFDENAVEAGLQLKEAVGGKLTVISLATKPAPEVIRALRHALAMGADRAILLDDPACEGGDSHSTAYTLAMAIKKLGDYDLILCGRQAADWDAGQVGLGIAVILNLPAATPVRKIEASNGSVRVECITEDGYELLELPLPSVLALSNEANTPRLAPLRGVITAAKQEIPTWTAIDIDADAAKLGAPGARISIVELAIPTHEGICEFITGDSSEEAAIKLVERLRSEKVI